MRMRAGGRHRMHEHLSSGQDPLGTTQGWCIQKVAVVQPMLGTVNSGALPRAAPGLGLFWKDFVVL